MTAHCAEPQHEIKQSTVPQVQRRLSELRSAKKVQQRLAFKKPNCSRPVSCVGADGSSQGRATVPSQTAIARVERNRVVDPDPEAQEEAASRRPIHGLQNPLASSGAQNTSSGAQRAADCAEAGTEAPSKRTRPFAPHSATTRESCRNVKPVKTRLPQQTKEAPLGSSV